MRAEMAECAPSMIDRGAQLKETFGLEAFRPWQREAIDALLDDECNVLVVAPTGGGKSLCYQYPATELPGTSVVVSPLIALMEDQVRALEARGIAATFIASTLELDEVRRRERALADGEYKLVYLAPERLNNRFTMELLQAVAPPMIAIDEAHCISQWGHDFRPEYMRLGGLIEALRPKHVLACTATATPHVRDEILARLGLEGRARVVLRGFARPNLHLRSEEIDGLKPRRDAAIAILKETLGEPAKPEGAAIVYAATRKNTDTIADALRKAGFRAAGYHAGMPSETRAEVNRAFASGELDVVAATNAFGMGIDRADIRTVVHVQAPGSIEAYYQEVGRAGRDGQPAHGVLLASATDMGLRKRLIDMRGGGRDHAARQWGLFLDLMRYVEAGSCRHDFILRYFGDDQETLGGCGHCDACERIEAGEAAEDPRDVSLIVRKALSGVARVRGRAGLRSIAEMLTGRDNQKIRRWGFDQLSTFGILKEHGTEWCVALLRRLITAGLVDLSSDEYPVLFITERGVETMKGEREVRVLLPPPGAGKRRRGARGGSGSSSSKTKENLDLLDDATRTLFEALRAARADIARERGVPAYVICHDRTLLEIASMRPTNVAALGEVHGMGPSRIENYGDRLLGVVAAQ